MWNVTSSDAYPYLRCCCERFMRECSFKYHSLTCDMILIYTAVIKALAHTSELNR